MNNFDLVLQYAKERQLVLLLRRAGKPLRTDASGRPVWTDDDVIAQYRFCNIHREDDTVTQWVRENIREPFADHKHLWFMLAIARRINLPATLEELLADKKGAWPVKTYNPERMMAVLDARTARGEQVYTGAYMITAETGAAHKGQTKSRTTAYSNLLPLWQKAATIEPQLHHTLQGAFQAILGQGFAWGPFMTYEVVTDLRHTRYLREAPDVNTWANAGPGALRGLNRLFDRPLKASLKPEDANQEMVALLAAVNKKWPKSKGYHRWELRDVEHTLCEFDKWMRVRSGEGAPRSKYAPHL